MTTVDHNKSEAPSFAALRTVPVILKNGNRRIEVNALLDDASTRTYLNSDVAAQLGLQGEYQRVSVNVLNGRVEAFETMPVELEVESVDGQFTRKISALTTDRVTGNLRIIDWRKESNKWKHLQGIAFPKQRTARPIIDILIGIDCLDLHYSYNIRHPGISRRPNCKTYTFGLDLYRKSGRQDRELFTDKLYPCLFCSWRGKGRGN